MKFTQGEALHLTLRACRKETGGSFCPGAGGDRPQSSAERVGIVRGIRDAGYAFGLVRNHPYRDGNKRIGFLAMVTFLGLNGHAFAATDEEVVTQFVALAAGDVPEEALATWIRRRSKPDAGR